MIGMLKKLFTKGSFLVAQLVKETLQMCNTQPLPWNNQGLVVSQCLERGKAHHSTASSSSRIPCTMGSRVIWVLGHDWSNFHFKGSFQSPLKMTTSLTWFYFIFKMIYSSWFCCCLKIYVQFSFQKHMEINQQAKDKICMYYTSKTNQKLTQEKCTEKFVSTFWNTVINKLILSKCRITLLLKQSGKKKKK